MAGIEVATLARVVHQLAASIWSLVMESHLPLSFAVPLFGFILSLGMVTLSLTGSEAWQQLTVDSLPDSVAGHGQIAGVFPPPIYLLEACI